LTGPVLAFDINATRGGKITRVETAKSAKPTLDATDVQPDIQPELQADERYSEEAKSRADLAATYAGLLGVDVVRSDLLEVLALEDGEDISSQSIAQALEGQKSQTQTLACLG